MLEFDERYTIGDIFLRQDGDPPDQWRWFSHASGNVALPEKAAVRLVFYQPLMYQLRVPEATTPAVTQAPATEDVFAALHRIDPAQVEEINLSYFDRNVLHQNVRCQIDLSWLPRFSDLRGLTLRAPYNDPRYLSSLPSLEALDLVLDESTDGDDFRWIAGSRSLKKLDLQTWSITGNQLRNLRGNQSLATLSLFLSHHIPADTIEILSTVPFLRKLDLFCVSLSAEEQFCLGNLTSLRSLSIYNVEFLDDAFAHLCERLTGLAELEIASQPLRRDTFRGMSDEAFRSLPDLRALESLTIDQETITDAVTPYLAPFPALRRLDFSASRFTGAQCDRAFWEKLPALRELSLRPTPVRTAAIEAACAALPELLELSVKSDESQAVLRPVSTLDHLTHLELEMPVDKESASYLARLPQLRELQMDLPTQTLSGADFAFLRELKHLKLLDVYNVRRGNSILRFAADVGGLETLRLTRCNITDPGLRHLHRLPRLRTLRLGNNRITVDGIRRIGEELPSLRSLSISNNRFRVRGAPDDVYSHVEAALDALVAARPWMVVSFD